MEVNPIIIYNSPEKIKVKCVKLCPENCKITKIKKKNIYLRLIVMF